MEKLKAVEKLAKVLDNQFIFPGTKFRFGLDPVIGLIPLAGDITTFIVSSMLLRTIAKHGASNKVVVLMTLNILVDAVFGSIPIIGNIFDFFYKANQKNVRLLKEHYEEGKHQGSGKGILILIAFIFIVALAGVIFGVIKLYQYLLSLL